MLVSTTRSRVEKGRRLLFRVGSAMACAEGAPLEDPGQRIPPPFAFALVIAVNRTYALERSLRTARPPEGDFLSNAGLRVRLWRTRDARSVGPVECHAIPRAPRTVRSAACLVAVAASLMALPVGCPVRPFARRQLKCRGQKLETRHAPMWRDILRTPFDSVFLLLTSSGGGVARAWLERGSGGRRAGIARMIACRSGCQIRSSDVSPRICGTTNQARMVRAAYSQCRPSALARNTAISARVRGEVGQ